MSFGLELGLGLGVGDTSGAPAFNPAALSVPLVLSLVADAGNITLNSGNVAQWSDTTAGAHHFAQGTAGSQPLWVPAGGSGINGKGSVRGQGTAFLTCAHTMSAIMNGATAGERFILAKLDADGVNDPLGQNWGSGSIGSFFEFTDTFTYDEFASTTRQQVTVGAGILTSPFVQNVQSSTGAWKMLINGVQKFSTGTNAYGVPAIAPTLLSQGASVSVAGQVRAVFVFRGLLTPTERTAMNAYVAAL